MLGWIRVVGVGVVMPLLATVAHGAAGAGLSWDSVLYNGPVQYRAVAGLPGLVVVDPLGGKKMMTDDPMTWTRQQVTTSTNTWFEGLMCPKNYPYYFAVRAEHPPLTICTAAGIVVACKPGPWTTKFKDGSVARGWATIRKGTSGARRDCRPLLAVAGVP